MNSRFSLFAKRKLECLTGLKQWIIAPVTLLSARVASLLEQGFGRHAAMTRATLDDANS